MNKKLICNRGYLKIFEKSTKSRYLVEIENSTDKNLTILGDFEPLTLKPLEKINIPKTETDIKLSLVFLKINIKYKFKKSRRSDPAVIFFMFFQSFTICKHFIIVFIFALHGVFAFAYEIILTINKKGIVP